MLIIRSHPIGRAIVRLATGMDEFSHVSRPHLAAWVLNESWMPVVRSLAVVLGATAAATLAAAAQLWEYPYPRSLLLHASYHAFLIAGMFGALSGSLIRTGTATLKPRLAWHQFLVTATMGTMIGYVAIGPGPLLFTSLRAFVGC